jgi:hypothetical protein
VVVVVGGGGGGGGDSGDGGGNGDGDSGHGAMLHYDLSMVNKGRRASVNPEILVGRNEGFDEGFKPLPCDRWVRPRAHVMRGLGGKPRM